jgi:hypothetical protein
MSIETDLERTLHSHLDGIRLPMDMPAGVARRARRRRRTKLAALGIGSTALIVGLALVGVLRGLPTDIDIRPAGRKPIQFENLPVTKSGDPYNAPLAPPQFPDCTPDRLDINRRVEGNRIALTLRPREGVQCGLDWWPGGFFTDATGQVTNRPRCNVPICTDRSFTQGRILLMGANGAEHNAWVRAICELERPVTYNITLADEAVEVRTIDEPRCGQGGGLEKPYSYRGGGLETPMAFLDPSIDEVERERPDVLSFILTLVNDTDGTIGVGRCPFYDVTYVTSEGKTRLRSYLNCPAAPDEVSPGEALRFSIEMPLRSLDRPGRLNLTLRDENRPLHKLQKEVPAP